MSKSKASLKPAAPRPTEIWDGSTVKNTRSPIRKVNVAISDETFTAYSRLAADRNISRPDLMGLVLREALVSLDR